MRNELGNERLATIGGVFKSPAKGRSNSLRLSNGRSSLGLWIPLLDPSLFDLEFDVGMARVSSFALCITDKTRNCDNNGIR